MYAMITNKLTGATARAPSDGIVLEDPSVVKLFLYPRDILKFERHGDDLVLHLRTGKIIRIENFYVNEEGQESQLILEDDDGNLWLGKFGDGLADFSFVEIASVDELATATGLSPLLLGLLALGGGAAVAGAAAGSGRSRADDSDSDSDSDADADADADSDSDADFELNDVDDIAVLESSVTFVPEATPSIDEASRFDLLGLNVGNLLTLDIGSGHPLVEFDLDEGTNQAVLDLEISGALSIGVLSDYVLIIERFENDEWVRAGDLGNDVDGNGILSLTVLGLGGTDGQVTLEDLPAGEYRAALVPDPGLISVGAALTRNLSVTATDLIETEEITVSLTAEGNFISEAASGDLTDLEVVSVEIDGTTYLLSEGPFNGQYGSLTIDANGEYVYTPNIDAPAGSVDSFTITVSDGTDEVSAQLNIEVEVQDAPGEDFLAGDTVPMMALSIEEDGDVRSKLAYELGILCGGDGQIRVGSHQQTSIEGVYAAGDVVDSLNQIAVAFGQAATAATAIHNSLSEQEQQ